MDGFGSTGDLVVIAASNLLEMLDQALLRPGRFDRQIFVSPPDVGGRQAILEGPHAQQAARLRRRLRADRAPDGRPLRRRPGEHRQRGGDLRGPRALLEGRQEPLRRRARARRGRHAVAQGAQRARAPRDRLPRGRPRAVRRAAARRRPRAPDLDRPPRPRARLHAEPARRGPLPQDARGAARPDGHAARRPRGGGDRLRRRARPARPTTSSASPTSRARWSTSTRWARRSSRCS